MKVKPLDEIVNRINSIEINETFDLIVAIANGGLIPAALLNQRLQVDFQFIKLNFRNAKQQPVYSAPQLLEDLHFDVAEKRILLVEDRVKTGATLQYAKELLSNATMIKTLAVNGKADYSLFDEPCFLFPWII